MITRRNIIKSFFISAAIILIPNFLFEEGKIKWRICECWANGKWEKISMGKITKGDIFRLWEKNKLVREKENYYMFRADEDAKPCDPPGNYIVASTAVENSALVG